MEKLTSQEMLIISIMLTRLRSNPVIGGVATVTQEEIDAIAEKIAKAAEEGRI